MSFREQTSAFFDELSSMLDEERKAKQEELGSLNEPQGDASAGPYSDMLTQEETPVTKEYDPGQFEEPTVITRYG